MDDKRSSKQRLEGEDRSAFRIGDQRGEGGLQDIQDELRDQDELQEDEVVGTAQTGEQNFARDGQGALEK